MKWELINTVKIENRWRRCSNILTFYIPLRHCNCVNEVGIYLNTVFKFNINVGDVLIFDILHYTGSFFNEVRIDLNSIEI